MKYEERGSEQSPSLFSVLQMPLGNWSKSATYRYHRYLKFPCHTFLPFGIIIMQQAYLVLVTCTLPHSNSLLPETELCFLSQDRMSNHCFQPSFISEQPFCWRRLSLQWGARVQDKWSSICNHSSPSISLSKFHQQMCQKHSMNSTAPIISKVSFKSLCKP